jgi:hypothetical protein
MRRSDKRIGDLFSYVDLEDRVPARHPLRVIRRIRLSAEINKSNRHMFHRGRQSLRNRLC